MILKDFLSSPAVNEFVQCYRIAHFVFDQGTPVPYKPYVPRPEQCLHFIVRGTEIAELADGSRVTGLPIAIFGQQTAVINRRPGTEFLILQIAFQPGALYKLTGIASSEFTNQYVNAEDIFSYPIRFVHEQLQESTGYDEMITIANAFMTKLISLARKDFHLLDKVGAYMLGTPNKISIDWMAKESCLCTRQFKRKFNQRVGVNPKTFARLVRFMKAYNLKNKFPERSWSSIAMNSGYCDYHHLVKDYKEFSGITPNQLHLLQSNSPECILGLAKTVYKTRG